MFSWKNKKILITGINGFVGNHLYKALREKEAIVYGVSHHIKDKYIFASSILNKSVIEKIITKNKIDIIFHLAGEALVENGQKDPYHTLKTNIIGTLNILELARIHALEKVIISSTAHVYGNNEVPFKEEYPAKPTRPYETSKAAADMLAQSYADTFNLPVVIPRFVNIYGPGDTNFTRLIPKMMKSIYADKHIQLWGGSAVRDYLYIDDAVQAYIKLAELDNNLLEKNRIFNIGTGKTVSVKDLVEKLRQASGVNCSIEKVESTRIDEISTQYVTSKKVNRLVGWTPKISVDEGIKKTALWYAEFFKEK